MKAIYTPTTQKVRWGSVITFGLLATITLFVGVRFANALSLSDDNDRRWDLSDASVPPPPPPPSEPPPPPEQEKEQDKPELEDKPPPLTLAQLEIALNPGTGGAAGDFSFSGFDANFDALAEIRIFELSELDKHPIPIQRVAPIYPYDLKRQGINGSVEVMFIVDENGNVRDARIQASSRREFEQPSLDAIRLWKFEPGVKDGKAVRTRVVQPIPFRISN